MTQLVLGLRSETIQILLTISIYTLLFLLSRRGITVSFQNHYSLQRVNTPHFPANSSRKGENLFVETSIQHSQCNAGDGKFHHQVIQMFK